MGDRSFFNLIKQSGFYAIGNAAIKLSGLILAPLYLNTSILSVDGYGQFAVLYVFAQICIAVVGLGLGNGMLRYVGKHSKEGEQDALPLTVATATIVLAVIFVGLMAAGSEWLASYFLEASTQGRVILLLGIYVACKVTAAVPMMLLRINERAGLYVLAIGLEMSVLIAGVFEFLVNQSMGIEGIFQAYALASSVQAGVLTVIMLFIVKWRLDYNLLKPVLAFGGPLVFMGLAGLILNAGDRFLLKELATNEVVGRYEWAARLSGALNLFVVQSFQLAFTVLGLKTLGSGDLSLHRRAFRHFSIWSAWAVLAISLLAFDLTAALGKIGVDAYYLTSSTLVFPLALGAMTYGVFVVINNVFFATAKTKLVTGMVIIAAGINIALNLVLIPVMGAEGAALATVVSYGLLVYLASSKAHKEINIQYRWSTFFTVVAIIVVLFLVGLTTQSWRFTPRILTRLSLVAAYFPLLFLFKIYSIEEIKQGWAFVRSKLNRTQG